MLTRVDEINFIDYEYGCYNYAAFDIANHFNEWAGFDCEFEQCPSEQVKREWISAYLSKRCQLEKNKGNKSPRLLTSELGV